MARRILLNDSWEFTGRDKTIELVNLPHTWNAIDGADGGNDYYRGTCIYQKSFKKPEYDEASERVFLEFLGVNASALVRFNGRDIACHDGGYSTFRVEISEYLQENNSLTVECDNSVNDKVYPQRADFTFYGGIYRDVNIVIVPRNHLDLSYNGAPPLKLDYVCDKSVVYRGESIYSKSVELDVESFLDLKDTELTDYTILHQVIDSDGNICGQQVSSPSLGYRGCQEYEQARYSLKTRIQLHNVRLWHGRKDPYLYTVRVKLSLRGCNIDEYETRIGFRFFEIDPRRGFILNGSLYPLRGVSRHQDRRDLGNAISYDCMEEDIKLIKEIGANTIRLAHYQHNQYFYDLCDEAGMVVWAEIPYITAHMPNAVANRNTKNQLMELIYQNYNHTSIFMWGLSNEITASWKNSWANCLNNHKDLQGFAKEADPSRLTTMACFSMCSPFHPVTRITDVIAWNCYFGWYTPFKWLNDVFMTFFHIIRPNKALGYSEYGAEAMPTIHNTHPRRDDNTEEYQAIYHEYMIRCFDRHPYLWGTYVWNMFDFAADARDQGGEPGMNHKGLVTFDRKVKKDSFYAYKAAWSDEPFVHIAGKRFENRPGDKLKIKVYSNLSKLSIYHNDKLLETSDCNMVKEFTIPMDAVNDIRVVASGNGTNNCKGTFDGDSFTDQCTIKHSDKLLDEYKTPKGNSHNWL